MYDPISSQRAYPDVCRFPRERMALAFAISVAARLEREFPFQKWIQRDYRLVDCFSTYMAPSPVNLHMGNTPEWFPRTFELEPGYLAGVILHFNVNLFPSPVREHRLVLKMGVWPENIGCETYPPRWVHAETLYREMIKLAVADVRRKMDTYEVSPPGALDGTADEYRALIESRRGQEKIESIEEEADDQESPAEEDAPAG